VSGHPATLAVLLHPALLGLGAAAAAVPIVIHLLSRRRVRPRRWAAMQWLLAALKRHQRRLRMENWLVLLLRVAALVLLGLGLSRWILSDSSIASLSRPTQSLILLLDTSYSTGAKDGARSVSDRIRAEADRTLSSLSGDDTVVVVVSNDVRADRTGTAPAVLVPRTVGREGAARAKEALGLVRPTEAPASWGDVLALVASKSVIQPEDVNRTFVWITDLQARDWRRAAGDTSGNDPLTRGIRAIHRMASSDREPLKLRVVDVSGTGPRGGKSLPNLSVADVSLSSASGDVFEKRSVDVTVKAWNWGPDPVDDASLRVFVDDQPAPARILTLKRLPPADPTSLKPGERVETITLGREVAFASPGAHSVRVEIAPRDADASADSLALDSRRSCAVSVRAKLKVAAWTEPTHDAQIGPATVLRAIFTGEGPTGDHYDLRTFSTESQFRDQVADPAWEPDLLVFANTAPRSSELQRAIASFVRGGGAILVFAGDRVDPAEWNGPFLASSNGGSVARLLPFAYDARVMPVAGRPTANDARIDFETKSRNPLARRLLAGDVGRYLRNAPVRVFGRMPLLDERPPPPGVTPSPAAPSDADDAVVLRFEGKAGRPGPVAVAEGRLGLGRAVFCAFGLDSGWMDDWTFRPIFLNETALEVTRPSESLRNFTVGQPLHVAVPRGASALRLQVPGRGEIPVDVREAPSESERPFVLFEKAGVSGVYRLSYQRAPVRGGGVPPRGDDAFSVSPDPGEGALQRVDLRDVESRVPGADLKVLSSFEEEAAATDGRREGELSTWILMAALLVLLCESFLAMKFGRHEAGGGGSAGPSPA
jgi:hypothetical protein